ncbi:hypothetical protein CC2G_001445 [Coprinopsis cinerea AmutBmut pab1-1]|nr:hypothetical protein CC2G_001445 [Coprinopsis cinerea AmutBmut pab1-1]
MSDDSEYDNFGDDFADIGAADWDRLLSAPPRRDPDPNQAQRGEEHAEIPRLEAQDLDSQSDDYFEDDEAFDSSVLAALDRIEQEATQARPSRITETAQSTVARNPYAGPSHSTNNVQNRHNETLISPSAPVNQGNSACSIKDEGPTHSGVKRARSVTSSPKPAFKKGKMKECDEQDVAKALLSKLEEEFQCPVCFDILVASHVANPCGHSFCGPCGWHWIVTTGKKTCPACRTSLARTNKMLPNVSLDNAIERYLEIIGAVGHEEWSAGGQSYVEFTRRKEAWKSEADQRTKQNAPRRKPSRAWSGPIFIPIEDDDEAADPTYQEDFDASEEIPIYRMFPAHPTLPYRRRLR